MNGKYPINGNNLLNGKYPINGENPINGKYPIHEEKSNKCEKCNTILQFIHVS